METFSALLAICAGNSPVTGEYHAQRPVTWSFDVFFDLRLNKRMSKQSWGWCFDTLSRPLWRHSNGNIFMNLFIRTDRVLRNCNCSHVTSNQIISQIFLGKIIVPESKYEYYQPPCWKCTAHLSLLCEAPMFASAVISNIQFKIIDPPIPSLTQAAFIFVVVESALTA